MKSKHTIFINLLSKCADCRLTDYALIASGPEIHLTCFPIVRIESANSAEVISGFKASRPKIKDSLLC